MIGSPCGEGSMRSPVPLVSPDPPPAAASTISGTDTASSAASATSRVREAPSIRKRMVFRIARVTPQTKFTLTEDRIPTHWVNLLPDLPGKPLPPLNPGTMQPAGPDDLTPIFPMEIIGQEVSGDPEVEIPEAVRDAYRIWRPTPLVRAHRLERELDTPARIYYKYEGVSPAGSHKPNSAVAQAYANKVAGVRRLSTETGAGQWGSALALACSLFGLECVVYMVGASYDQKPYRRAMMESWGATVIRSPSDTTEAGRSQASHPTGSLGIAISEAVEVAAGDEGTNYALGSVLNHVCLHQTVIGQEAIEQLGICTRSATTSCRRRCTPAACATTATPRCSAGSSKPGWSRRAPTSRTRPSRRRSGSRERRGSSRAPNRRTPSVPCSTRPRPPERPARSA